MESHWWQHGERIFPHNNVDASQQTPVKIAVHRTVDSDDRARRRNARRPLHQELIEKVLASDQFVDHNRERARIAVDEFWRKRVTRRGRSQKQEAALEVLQCGTQRLPTLSFSWPAVFQNAPTNVCVHPTRRKHRRNSFAEVLRGAAQATSSHHGRS